MTATANFAPVKYIGKRATHRDGMYGTQINWLPGQTQPVPNAVAAKMFKHIDVYAPGDALTGPEPLLAELAPKEQTADEKTQEVRDQISNWGKAALAEYVKTNFRQDLDKKLSVADMRIEATRLVDQFGA